MLKVLHIIDSGGLYGAEVMLLNLIQEQIMQYLEPVIASIGEKNIKEKPLETEAIRRGFKVRKFRMMPGPNIAGAIKILRYARKNNFNLLHSHGYKGNILFGFIPKSIRKIPLVSTIHGYTSTNGYNKMRLYEWFDTKSLKFITAVVLVSNAMRLRPELKNLKSKNIHVIFNGIPVPDNTVTQNNDSTIQQFDKKIKAFCSRGFTIGSIGRLSTEKGYRYLIEALSLLKKNGIDARLIIIGEGYERILLEELAIELGLTDSIMLPGYKNDAKYYIPFFKVFVMSSLTEGLPITLLEAMQSKTPIIATQVGGVPEVLSNGQAGILVEPYNPDAIAKAVMELHGNKELGDQLTSKAYQRVATDFSSKTMALEYLNIYKKVLDG